MRQLVLPTRVTTSRRSMGRQLEPFTQDTMYGDGTSGIVNEQEPDRGTPNPYMVNRTETRRHPADITRMRSAAEARREPFRILDRQAYRCVQYRVPSHKQAPTFIGAGMAMLNSTIPRAIRQWYSLVDYRVSTQVVTPASGSLIDRGANGGLAGLDCRRMKKTGRFADVTGIDAHGMSNLSIGTVGAVISSDRGDLLGSFISMHMMKQER